jgi:hypothetical protein
MRRFAALGLVLLLGACGDDDGDEGGPCGGLTCAEGETCVEDTCTCGGHECPDGFACCDESCHDLQSDPEHCGACGEACSALEDCTEGDCVLSF